MDLERKYLLLFFAIGVISKGIVKVRAAPSYIFACIYICSSLYTCIASWSQSAFGANMSLILLLSVALYYWRMRRRDQTIYDDIARMQVETAAKLDKLNGVGDGKVNEMDLYVRKTQFQLDPDHASFITYGSLCPFPPLLRLDWTAQLLTRTLCGNTYAQGSNAPVLA